MPGSVKHKSICQRCGVVYMATSNGQKRCPLCMPIYNREYPSNYGLAHKDKMREISLKSYMLHREEILKRRKKLKDIRKAEVLTHYGNGKLVCVRCGFDDIRALSIDHINGNGAEERRRLGVVHGRVNFYCWLQHEGYPDGYQTLCFNCQMIKKIENKEYGSDRYRKSIKGKGLLSEGLDKVRRTC